MKGVITMCIAQLVSENFGTEKWEQILEISDLPIDKSFRPISDVNDEVVMSIINSTKQVLNLNGEQLADAFGDYWVNVFASKMYKAYFKSSKNAKDFLLRMDKVHETITKNIDKAMPPRFDYSWVDETTLNILYKSERGMIDFLPGLIKGVAKYYNEKLTVIKINNENIQVKFLTL